MRPHFLPLFALISLVGCAVVPSEAEPDSVESTEDALRSFKTGEVVGPIAYGETKTVDHTASPTYRALSFSAKKGDKIELRVSAKNFDAMAWLTGKSNATLKAANKFADTSEEVIVHDIQMDGVYHVAFREADYEPATFTVKLTKLNAPPAPSFAPCGGAPKFPVTGSLYTQPSERIDYERDCDAFGVCTAWKETARVPSSTIELTPSRYVKARLHRGSSSSWMAGVTYNCTTADELADDVDASGKGDLSIDLRERCMGCGSGCREMGSSVQSTHAADVSVGATCISILDRDPPAATNYGKQRKSAYVAKF